MLKVKRIVQDMKNSGEVVYQHGNDVVLVNPIPGTIPADYCYEFFKPLSDIEIMNLVGSYRKAFPKVLQEFYRISNGIFLFGRTISVFGVPVWGADYKQPVAIAFADGHRSDGCPDNRLFFGCYNTDPEVQLFFDTDDQAEEMPVYASEYGSNNIIKKWASFENWFVCEHNRLLKQYDNGEYSIEDIVKGELREIQFHSPFSSDDIGDTGNGTLCHGAEADQ